MSALRLCLLLTSFALSSSRPTLGNGNQLPPQHDDGTSILHINQSLTSLPDTTHPGATLPINATGLSTHARIIPQKSNVPRLSHRDCLYALAQIETNLTIRSEPPTWFSFTRDQREYDDPKYDRMAPFDESFRHCVVRVDVVLNLYWVNIKATDILELAQDLLDATVVSGDHKGGRGFSTGQRDSGKWYIDIFPTGHALPRDFARLTGSGMTNGLLALGNGTGAAS